jgi:hypothetical protein
MWGFYIRKEISTILEESRHQINSKPDGQRALVLRSSTDTSRFPVLHGSVPA